MSEKSQLINKLIANKTIRQAYVRSKVSTNVASQIRALRRRRGEMTQLALAQEAEMKQSRISAMERPGTRFNIETLVRLASAFRVGLMVRFVSLSEMLKWENTFSQDTFDVRTINDDSDFLNPSEEFSPVEDPGQAVVAELLGGKFNSPQGAGMGNVNIGQNPSNGGYQNEAVCSNASQGSGIYRNL